ncbi:MAG: hypothetical protein ACTSR2_04145 [Candidatus Hodarchaeales archaeon]
MPEVPIPGMAFRVRLTKKRGKNVLELVFRNQSISSVDMGSRMSESAIESALKHCCREADIEHQVTDNAISNVAKELFRQAGLGEGKVLLPEEFEISSDSSELDRKLAIIISTLQGLEKRLDKIEAILESQMIQK